MMKTKLLNGLPNQRRNVLCGFLALLFLAGPVVVTAREGAPPQSRSQKTLPLLSVKQTTAPLIEPQKEIADDERLGRLAPLRYAVPQMVALSPTTSGTWEPLTNGRLWRLRVESPGATDLNFGFTNFWLPPGATLHICSDSEDYIQGPYTAEDNQPSRQLWTSVVPGSSAVIELFIPNGAPEQPQLVLGQISSGYRDLFKRHKSLEIPKAGACEVDVICPQGDPWRNEIRSAARYSIGGIGFCSGTLVMNAVGDFKNYFLTANHCHIDVSTAPTVVVYWNFESPTCGQHGGGSLAQNQSGATFRAARADVDVALIELNQTPSPTFNVHYAGWDRSGTAPSGVVGIHHPNADEKSICFSSSTPGTIDSCIGSGGVASHWQVVWNLGVTEPGSSGSAIWGTSTHLIIGTLSGGGSACSAQSAPDCYGKFSVAWDGSTSATRLKDWLDPLNSGVTSVNGRDPVDVGVASVTLSAQNCPPANGGIDPYETVTVDLALRNNGHNNTVNLVATLLATNGIAAPSAAQTYGVLNTNGTPVSQAFTFTALGNCGDTLSARFQLQDGAVNLGNAFYTFVMGGYNNILTQNFDTVSAPAIPSGWNTFGGGLQPPWTTSTTRRDTLPNSAFSPNASKKGANELISPVMALPATPNRLSFRHYFALEAGFDGGVLEMKIGGGAYTDILAAGGTFVSGNYTHVISTGYGSAIAGRQAWSGSSGAFITTTINLPSAAGGQNVQFKWRCATDTIGGGEGWYVDTVTLATLACCNVTPARPVLLDPQATNDVYNFTLSGDVGRKYSIESSTLLTNWTTLSTFSNATGLISFAATNAFPLSNQFYRARLVP